MKMNRKSDIIQDFTTKTLNDIDNESIHNRSFQVNSPISSHFNPINKSKYKVGAQKQSLSKRQSIDSNLTRHSSKIFSQIKDINNTYLIKPWQKIRMKQNSHFSVFSELLTDLIRRVDKNERQIQQIKKGNRDEFYDGMVFGSNHRGSDFKEIKDLYMLIRDQNMIQSQFNKRINDQISQIKLHPINKVSLQKLQQDNKIKKIDKLILQLQSLIKSHNISKFNIRLQQLSQKFEQISERIKKIENSRQFQPQTRRKSDQVCENENLMGVIFRIKESQQKKKGNLHQRGENMTLYYIDKHGYILDEDKYYLVNEENSMIQIKEDQLHKIKEKCQLIL